MATMIDVEDMTLVEETSKDAAGSRSSIDQDRPRERSESPSSRPTDDSSFVWPPCAC